MTSNIPNISSVQNPSLAANSNSASTFSALDPGACHFFTKPARPSAPACRNALINIRYTFIHRNEDNNNIVSAYADLANKLWLKYIFLVNGIIEKFCDIGAHRCSLDFIK